VKIQFHIDLPRKNLQRLGGLVDGPAHDEGFVRPVHNLSGLVLEGRSMKGFSGRELNRFFPVILLLESQTTINQWQMRQKKYAPLYDSGVYYQAEPPGCEDWLDTPTLYKQGWGDCEDIACCYTAELRERENISAVPCIKFKDFLVNGQLLTLIHVMTLMPDGSVQDPSKVLGMDGEYQ